MVAGMKTTTDTDACSEGIKIWSFAASETQGADKSPFQALKDWLPYYLLRSASGFGAATRRQRQQTNYQVV